MTDKTPPLLIDRVEAGRRLSVSPRTIDAMIRRGELPAVHVGRRVLISPDDLWQWVQDKKAAAPEVSGG